MFLSKMWIVLLAAVAGLATGVSLLGPRAYDNAVSRKDEDLLRRGYVVAELFLETHAWSRRRGAAEVGRDAPLANRLVAQATAKDPAARVAAVSEIKSKLEGFNSQLGAGLGLVVDDQGMVVQRVGAGSSNAVDSVRNTAVVRKALSGQDDKDSWVVEGRLFRVVGAPVTGQGGKVVGGVVFGFEFNDELAGQMHARTGTDVVFFLDQKAIAKSTIVYEAVLGELPPMLKKTPGLSKSPKPSDPEKLLGGKVLAMGAGLQGEAAEQGAVYALTVPHKRVGTLLEFVRSRSPEDWRAVPWGLVIGGSVGGMIFGFLFFMLGAERPLKRMLRETKELAEGAGARLDDRRYGGKFGSLARAINDVLRKGSRPAPAEAFISGGGNVTKEINMILGGVASPRQFELPGAEPPAAQGTMIDVNLAEVARAIEANKAANAAKAAPPPPKAEKPAPPAKPPAEKPAKPPVPEKAAKPEKPPAPPSTAPTIEAAAPPPPPAKPKPEKPAAPPPPASVSVAKVDGHSGARPAPQPPPASIPPTRAQRAVKPPTLLQPSSVADAFDEAPIPAADVQQPVEREDFGEATVVAEVPDALLKQSARGDSTLDEAVHYREIFEQFVDTKKKCGEPTANLTYEKFVTKLEANREQIVSRYACRSVRFQVYVKDGKAALKATPVKT